MENTYERNARVFKAFCDARRLRILDLLRGGEKCACVLVEEMGMPQSSLSYHMKILCESGVVVGREEGKWTHYHISQSGSREAMALLQAITAAEKTAGAGTCCAACTKE